MVKVNLISRTKSSKFPAVIELDGSTTTVTVDQLKQALYKKLPKYYPDRQRLTTVDKKVLEEGKTLAEAGVKDGDELVFKDLGPQVGWRTVFLIEYSGPLLIHPLIYHLAATIYPTFTSGTPYPGHSQIQSLTYYLVTLHFLKRELETMFVHRFSHGTMPFRNIFKNSAHYWILSGIVLGGAVYGPWNAKGSWADSVEGSVGWVWTPVAVWGWAELSNLITHVTLRNLRPPGTRVRKIPYGYGFDLVSCPNYFFETITWLAIVVLTRSWAAILFAVVAVAQMYVWAVKKHRLYRKEFREYPRDRKAMFPFIA